MTGGLRFPTVPCSPGGEDGPSIVTLIEACRSFLALDLNLRCCPSGTRGLVASASPLQPRTRDARIRQALDLVENKMLLLLLPLPLLLLL